MKVIDTREYVSMLKELTDQGQEASMTVAGSSMTPFLIHERDLIVFKKPERSLKRGDIVFFQRANGQYVLHRICKVKKEGYYIVGDAQREMEGPVAREQIFALVVRVKRDGRWMQPGDFWWEFFEHVWIHMIPFRRKIMKIYAGLMSDRKEP